MSNPISSLFTWIKANKLSAFLLALIAYSLYSQYQAIKPFANQANFIDSNSSGGMMTSQSVVAGSPMMAKSLSLPITGGGFGGGAPDVAPADRLVSRSTYLSIKVLNVSESLAQIEAMAVKLGGFMVDSNLSSLDAGADGSISVRVPSEKRDVALATMRQTGIRVVSENVQGTDITQEYQDTTEQLRILNLTKTKFEALLNKAEKVSDMLDVQQELSNLQRQIDSHKGQQEYLANSAKYTLITAFLSTDELALPYSSPSQAWRPSVIFKEAVRGFMTNVRGLGNNLIWIGVYTPFWLPVLLAYLWWTKRQKTQVGV